jgi:hypothetical protein
MRSCIYQPQPCSEANWDDKVAIVMRPNSTEVAMPTKLERLGTHTNEDTDTEPVFTTSS